MEDSWSHRRIHQSIHNLKLCREVLKSEWENVNNTVRFYCLLMKQSLKRVTFRMWEKYLLKPSNSRFFDF